MTMQTKPLRETQATTHKPSGTSTANPKSGTSFVESPEPVERNRGQARHSIDDYAPHSKHRAEASRHYHEVVVGKTATGQFGDRAIERLNPTQAAPRVRSFPGLANG